MKAVGCFTMTLLFQQVICGIIRNPPSFAKPMYSDSYLPAAMQVIFHAVEQLKLLQSEETSQSTTSTRIPLTSPITHASQNQPSTVQYSPTTIASTTLSNEPKDDEKEADKMEETSTEEIEESSKDDMEESLKDQIKYPSEDKIEETKIQDTLDENTDASKMDERLDDKMEEQETQEPSEDKVEVSQVQSSEDKMVETSTLEEIGEESNPQIHQEPPEVNEETPETNYATPETNYEMAEDVHVTQETNEEIPEENYELTSADSNMETRPEIVHVTDNPTVSPVNRESINQTEEEKKKEPTIDSVVQDVYEILKPTPSKFVDEDTVVTSGESKNILGVPVETIENVEDEDDETRFTRLGEKVTQVPRPSLSSYLRRSKVPPSATLQQLASLYDSLSKDARKQGFGKYTGYSDEVLNTLQTSAEGGVGPQLKKILAKMLERNELTRDDAKTRSSQVIRDLDNPSSILSKELRPLLPLRYAL
ncbi:hypothetical protein ANTQUA_LOCUS2614 [Anthophora quadrimaculata]